MAAHSSILARSIPWTGEIGGPTVHGVSGSRTQLKVLSTHLSLGQSQRATLQLWLETVPSKVAPHPQPGRQLPRMGKKARWPAPPHSCLWGEDA